MTATVDPPASGNDPGPPPTQESSEVPPWPTDPLAEKFSDIGKRLAGGFAAITAVFTFLGVTTGGVERLLRNEPHLSLLCFVLIGLAIAVGIVIDVVPMARVPTRIGVSVAVAVALASVVIVAVADTFLSVQDPRSFRTRLLAGALLLIGLAGIIALASLLLSWRHRFDAYPDRGGMPLRAVAVISGLALFISGFYGAVRLATESKGTKERPDISANLTSATSGFAVEGTVKANGVRSDEHILFELWGTPVTGERQALLYASRAGADPEGKVARSFKVELGAGHWSRVDVFARVGGEENGTTRCDPQVRSFACTTIWLPLSPAAPNITVTWPASPTNDRLALISTKLASAGPRVVLVEVWRQGEVTALYRNTRMAEPTGNIEATAEVSAGPAGSRLCVVATIVGPEQAVPTPLSPDLKCPVSRKTATALEVVVPPATTTTTSTGGQP